MSCQSSDLVYSAYVGGKQDVFPKLLQLYVVPDSIVADVTFGKGVFCRHVPEGKYDLGSAILMEVTVRVIIPSYNVDVKGSLT